MLGLALSHSEDAISGPREHLLVFGKFRRGGQRPRVKLGLNCEAGNQLLDYFALDHLWGIDGRLPRRTFGTGF